MFLSSKIIASFVSWEIIATFISTERFASFLTTEIIIPGRRFTRHTAIAAPFVRLWVGGCARTRYSAESRSAEREADRDSPESGPRHLLTKIRQEVCQGDVSIGHLARCSAESRTPWPYAGTLTNNTVKSEGFDGSNFRTFRDHIRTPHGPKVV